MKSLRLPTAWHQDIKALFGGLRFIYCVVPRYTSAALLVTLAQAVLPAANVWLVKWVIDSVAATVRNPQTNVDQGHLTLLLAASYLLLVALQQSVLAFSRLLHGHVYDKLTGRVTLYVTEKTSRYTDLSPFESPRFHDRLQLLQNEVSFRPMHCSGAGSSD